jgi:hypothetical protein
VAILTPEHLFERADGLLNLYPRRKPRQTELRRAISAAYYGIFHFILTQAADAYIGATYHSEPRYALAYRSISHGGLRALCLDVIKPSMPDKLKPYVPIAGFGPEIRVFAAALANLQDRRHDADHDPSISVVRKDAQIAIDTARSAIGRFRSADMADRQAFLALLVFSVRGRA